MSQNQKPTHSMPGGAQEENSKADDGVVNDSLGTVDTADTTGTGEENQPCEKPEKSSRNSPGHQAGKPYH